MRGKKGKSPPFLSQEFIIQNHGDIVSCMCMVVMVGLMFQVKLFQLEVRFCICFESASRLRFAISL